jgi:esterase/lipase superfamily enzyme
MKSLLNCLLALFFGSLFCSLVGCGAERGDTMSASAENRISADADSGIGSDDDSHSQFDAGISKLEGKDPVHSPMQPSNRYSAQPVVVSPSDPVGGDPSVAMTTPDSVATSDFEPQLSDPPVALNPPRVSERPSVSKSAARVPMNTIQRATRSKTAAREDPTAPVPDPSETIAGPEIAAIPGAAAESEEPTIRSDDDVKKVTVFYGTDRLATNLPSQPIIPAKPGIYVTMILLVLAVIFLTFNRAKASVALATSAAVIFTAVILTHNDSPNREGIVYGGQRGTFVRGIATVSIPASHQRGIVERPSIYRFEFEEDESQHVVLSQANELGFDEFYQAMDGQLAQASEKDLLLFVHGFNVDFDSAVRRTAQIAHDLEFPGVPVCYSWPSQGTMIGYPIDENNVTWTVSHLREFLVELSRRSGARSIDVIAHSMGNRAVTSAISQISLEHSGESLPMFGEVVLAAPDVDADHFRKELAPRLAMAAQHVTLYASSDDQALAASKHLHGGYPRAGESGENLVVVPDIETIDVSGIDLSLLGHSYYGSSESILRDLHALVRNGLTAHQRDGLISRQIRDATYWLLRTPQMSEAPTFPVR